MIFTHPTSPDELFKGNNQVLLMSRRYTLTNALEIWLLPNNTLWFPLPVFKQEVFWQEVLKVSIHPSFSEHLYGKLDGDNFGGDYWNVTDL